MNMQDEHDKVADDVSPAPTSEVSASEMDAAPDPSAPPTSGNEAPEPSAQTPPADSSAAEAPAAPHNENMKWYVVKVQSGREESIKDAIEKRVKIEGLQDYFGQIIIPVERVTEMRNNKRVVKERKLYAGYLMVQLEFEDRMLYLFRETSGVGDFVGGGLNKPPQPMRDDEVERILNAQLEIKGDVVPKSKFDRGDRVRVKDGTFAGMEGEVKEVLEAKGALRVELTIFGRPVPVELEYWQVDYA